VDMFRIGGEFSTSYLWINPDDRKPPGRRLLIREAPDG
jgi:hypothetical protein